LPLKVYIAAPYPERATAVALMHACEAIGIEVTSRWLKAPDALSDAFAREDIADVTRADMLLAYNPPAYAEKGTGGRHVELGYALALGKKVILVGPRSNIFHYLTDVSQTDAETPEAIARVVARRAL
jgi:nucleoside 2-deoxyribosyltransferase